MIDAAGPRGPDPPWAWHAALPGPELARRVAEEQELERWCDLMLEAERRLALRLLGLIYGQHGPPDPHDPHDPGRPDAPPDLTRLID